MKSSKSIYFGQQWAKIYNDKVSQKRSLEVVNTTQRIKSYHDAERCM